MRQKNEIKDLKKDLELLRESSYKQIRVQRPFNYMFQHTYKTKKRERLNKEIEEKENKLNKLDDLFIILYMNV